MNIEKYELPQEQVLIINAATICHTVLYAHMITVQYTVFIVFGEK